MKPLLTILISCFSLLLLAHPMPASVLLLDMRGDGVSAELHWPLKEFQLAFPAEDIEAHPDALVASKSKWLDGYLHAHISVSDSAGHEWTIEVRGKRISKGEQEATGTFSELVYTLWLQPPAGVSPRHFVMHYDAIMHQVVTHKMLIRIRQDWDGGLSPKDSLDAELGVLMMNPRDNQVPPLIVNLDAGSRWKGFKSMVMLGIGHISEGTDHLLFLLVLLLPSILIVVHGRWGGFGGTSYSLVRLLKIVTAFTVGHSVSLILGSLRLVSLPQQPVEIAIGVTILITGIHAIRPLFAGREVVVACFFGLIHGLAFSAVIAGLNIDSSRLAISILGFNIGIEIMQLFVILCTIPWLVMLGQYSIYQYLRIAGASIAIVASLGWIAERIQGHPNVISLSIMTAAAHSIWLLLALVLLALSAGLYGRFRRPELD